MRRLLPLLLLMLPACRDQRPPAPTPEESARLDETENMLNQLDDGSVAEPENKTP